MHNKDIVNYFNVPERKGGLIKHKPGTDELEHGDDMVCLRLLVLNDGLLYFLAPGQRMPAEYLAYLNKGGVEVRVSTEAAKLSTEWAILVFQEAKRKDGNSLLVCETTPVYGQGN